MAKQLTGTAAGIFEFRNRKANYLKTIDWTRGVIEFGRSLSKSVHFSSSKRQYEFGEWPAFQKFLFRIFALTNQTGQQV